MIEIKDVNIKFGDNIVLDNVTLTIPEKQKVSVIGPSGCGKSTLLRIVIALTRPSKGKVLIDGTDIHSLNEEDLMGMRMKLGMVFQSSALFDSMNVEDNVAFGLRQYGKLSETEIKRKVAEKLEMVELSGKQGLMVSELSGGMQKRVSLARAIATDPKYVLYDEPTTGLDPIISTTVEDLINKLSKELKMTALIVTHQLSTIFRTSDRIVMLNNGTLIEAGTVEQTKESKDPVVRNFIKGGLNDV